MLALVELGAGRISRDVGWGHARGSSSSWGWQERLGDTWTFDRPGAGVQPRVLWLFLGVWPYVSSTRPHTRSPPRFQGYLGIAQKPVGGQVRALSLLGFSGCLAW